MTGQPRRCAEESGSGTSDEDALAPLPGVSAARVDLDARTVTVEIDEARIDRARLVAAIEDQGYGVPA